MLIINISKYSSLTIGVPVKTTTILLLCFLFISCGEDCATQSQPAKTTRTYLHAYDYASNFFFVDTAYFRIYEEIMTSTDYLPTWIGQYRIKEIEVWEDKSNVQDVINSNGVAFADIEPKRLRQGESYGPSLKNAPIKSGEVERGRFVRLDSARYRVDHNMGFLSIKDMDMSHIYAIAYRTEGPTSGPEDDYYYGTLSTSMGLSDTVLLKLIYRPNMLPEYKTLWSRKMKNIYSVFEQNIDKSNSDIKIFYVGANGDTLDYLENVENKLPTVLSVDSYDNQTGQLISDGNFDLIMPYFDAKRGLIMFPSVEPFRNGIRQYFEKIGILPDAEQYVYGDIYDKTIDAAKLNADKDKFLIMFETRK